MPPGSAGNDQSFWRGRRVLVTGHTGFKGAWLCLWLERLGARVTGLALEPDHEPNLFSLLNADLALTDARVDLRNRSAVEAAIAEAAPEIVFHLAAQSLVRASLQDPLTTVTTNVLGTAHLLDSLRRCPTARAIVVVTSDKVYANDNSGMPCTESHPLGGDDPYSASKSACELLSHAWSASFLADAGIALATARAGNVIGGGDWARERLVPDLWRAISAGTTVTLRYPQATRPWQHVLEPLAGYLLLARALLERLPDVPASLNFGPSTTAPASVEAIAGWFFEAMGEPSRWERPGEPQPPEKLALNVDPARAGRTLNWFPCLSNQEAVTWTAWWYRSLAQGTPAATLCNTQIDRYAALAAHPAITPSA